MNNGIDRRQFLKIMGLGTAALTLPGFGFAGNNAARKPNIIFIMADDLGYADVGVYGQKKIHTPFLDKMAREGTKFTDYYCGSPVCAPSRSVLMTGQHTGHTRVRDNKSDLTNERVPLEKEDITIAEVLKKAGYTTGIVGKWGLGDPGSPGVPNEQGFDYWFGYLNQENAHSYYPPFLWRNNEKVRLEENKDGKRGQYSHDLFAEESLKFIERNKSNPFFLYIPFTIPHAELLVPEDSLNEYKGKLAEKGPYPGKKGGYSPQETPHAAYAAMVTRMDRDIGRIFEKLKELGIDDETIVFFTSDNGPNNTVGMDTPFFDSNGPLRGGKRDVYEGGIRVPMIVRWPGKIKADQVSNQAWAAWDFLPTAAALAGTESTDNIDGISMLPAILGKPQNDHEYLYWEYRQKGFQQAVRMGNWKAVRLGLDQPVELYDLATDIGETNNIAEEHPEIVKKMRKIFREAHVNSKHWPMKMIED